MTYKNAKTILFASLLVAMILPFSVMGIVDAAPNENVNDKVKESIFKDDFIEAVKQVHDMRSEKLNLQLEKQMDLTDSDKIKNERALEAIESKISKKIEILDAYETQRKAVFYIEPTREQYILSIVKDLRADVKSFGSSVDMQSYGVNIDYLNKGITVATSDPSYDSTIQQLIDKYPTDVKIKLVHGMAVDESCSSRTADCNPIVGGIQTESDGQLPSGNDVCTLGLPVKQGTTYGFITAGHCINDNKKLHQPNEWFWFNEIGNNANSHYVSTCDCAFVDKTTGTTSKSWVLISGNTYASITSEATSRPSTGTQVVLFGLSSGLQFGEVTNPNSTYTYNGVDWDLVETDLTTTGGDSGAPVTNSIGTQILGIHKGKTLGNDPVFTPWNEIDTKFGGLTLHS